MMWLVSILSFLLLLSFYYCIKFALYIISLQDSLENSLDLIEAKYQSVLNILEIPVFYDSVEVKQVLRDLDDVRFSLLNIADKLSSKDKNMLEESVDGEE